MTETLADLFAEARTLLEGKPDPAYDTLRKVVAKKCPGCPSLGCEGQHHGHWFEACDCGHVGRGTFYIPRTVYWEQASDGALEGSLVKALLQLGLSGNDAIVDKIADLGAFMGDTRIPAMQAVVEWLKGDA